MTHCVNWKKKVFMLAFFMGIFDLLSGHLPEGHPEILSTRMIWDRAPHSAFTDLIEYQGTWYCVFREGECHAGGKNGVIRVLASNEGAWESVSVVAKEGVDMRDPKLSITPKNELMLLVGGVTSGEVRNTHVAFSSDGKKWTPLAKVLDNEWLWRVTWYKRKGYGVSYRVEEDSWPVTLFVTEDGLHYDKVKEFKIEGKPSETTLRFTDTGQMVALMRRGSFPFGATLIGTSQSPYTNWTWHNTKTSFGGPNFLILPNGDMWASGRIMKFDEADELVERTTLAKMDVTSITPVIDLPSGGEDTSYPGMVYKDGILWISYYSSHEENNSAIYLTRIQF